MLLTVWSFIYYYTKRFKIVVHGKNERLIIEIKDPSLTAPFIINSPIKISTQWHEQLMGKGAKMKILYLTICNAKGDRLVTFEGALGSAYDVPQKFEYVNILDAEDRKRLIIAPKMYSTSKVRNLAEEITIYITYLEKKKESQGGHAAS